MEKHPREKRNKLRTYKRNEMPSHKQRYIYEWEWNQKTYCLFGLQNTHYDGVVYHMNVAEGVK